MNDSRDVNEISEKAASSAANTDNDETLAVILNTVETLTVVFGFDPEVASEAVQAIEDKSDVTAAYNWILDNGGADKGGPVAPIDNCPHLAGHVKVTPDMLRIDGTCDYFQSFASGMERGGEENTGGGKSVVSGKSDKSSIGGDGSIQCSSTENWICLECNASRCSRYVNGHSLQHAKSTGHCVAVSLSDLSVWCYECEAYVRHSSLDPILRRLEELKFGSERDDCLLIPHPTHCHTVIAPAASPSADASSTVDLPSNLAEMADYILSPRCKSVVILTGAGASVASGIPDFRSPGGMYETLRPELLTASEKEREAMREDPTMVFHLQLFLENSLPALELKRPFILGTKNKQWKATLAHRFCELLHKKTGKLKRLYTQNIDGLEAQCTELPGEKVIHVHGSMDKVVCAVCGNEENYDQFCKEVQTSIKDIYHTDPMAPSESRPILCSMCGLATVKPAVVLFGESLPSSFFDSIEKDLPDVDLLIIIGTSLMVAPVNSLVYKVKPSTIRMLINMEPVGQSLGIRYGNEAKRDVFVQGACEDTLLQLMICLDWANELSELVDVLPEQSALMVRKYRDAAKTRCD